MIREIWILLAITLQIDAKSASFGTNCNLDKGKRFDRPLVSMSGLCGSARHE